MSSTGNTDKTWKDAPTDVPAASSDTRDQPWKKFMAAESRDGGCENRPWVDWKPSKEEPWAKPWNKWSIDFGVDNFRAMSSS
jgi:hypothetical protein